MIRDWRRAWGEGDFPFLFVQLANFQDLGTISSFTLLREAQFQTLPASPFRTDDWPDASGQKP
jgi:sialate O-acetylesterase